MEQALPKVESFIGSKNMQKEEEDKKTSDRSRKSGRSKGSLSVSFVEGPPKIQEVHIDEDEVKQRWYTNGEYFFIKKEAMNSVRRLATTRVEESDSFSSRGLEIVDDAQVKRRKETIDGTVQTILEAQSKRGSNPEMLSPLYKQITQSCIKESLQNATRDANDAKEYHRDSALSREQISFLSMLCGCLTPKRSN